MSAGTPLRAQVSCSHAPAGRRSWCWACRRGASVRRAAAGGGVLVVGEADAAIAIGQSESELTFSSSNGWRASARCTAQKPLWVCARDTPAGDRAGPSRCAASCASATPATASCDDRRRRRCRPANGVVQPAVDGQYLVRVDVPLASGCAHDGVQVPTSAPAWLVSRPMMIRRASRRRARQLQALRQERIGRNGGRRAPWPRSRTGTPAVGVAPADTLFARGRQRLQPAGDSAAGQRLEVHGNEVALGQRFVSVRCPHRPGRRRGGRRGSTLGPDRRGFEDVVAIDAEHQAVVIARQDRAGCARCGTCREPGAPRCGRKGPAGRPVDERLVRMPQARPFEDPSADSGCSGGRCVTST